MNWWIKEYAMKRAIPIPKLLYVFDIVLVSTWRCPEIIVNIESRLLPP
jgi:hypothetical protein